MALTHSALLSQCRAVRADWHPAPSQPFQKPLPALLFEPSINRPAALPDPRPADAWREQAPALASSQREAVASQPRGAVHPLRTRTRASGWGLGTHGQPCSAELSRFLSVGLGSSVGDHGLARASGASGPRSLLQPLFLATECGGARSVPSWLGSGVPACSPAPDLSAHRLPSRP